MGPPIPRLLHCLHLLTPNKLINRLLEAPLEPIFATIRIEILLVNVLSEVSGLAQHRLVLIVSLESESDFLDVCGFTLIGDTLFEL